MTHASLTIQIAPESRPATPFWMGEVVAFAQVLTHERILKAIEDQVRFARARFSHYDVIDFVAVLIGYVLSGEPTLLSLYPRDAQRDGTLQENTASHRSLNTFLQSGK
jgi:hypothetical protein